MPSNPITIRTLGPEETHVLDRVRPGTCEGFDVSRAWAVLATRINDMVVALDQGEVIGFAYGTMLIHPDRPNTFIASAVRVHDDYPSAEISTRLIDRLRNLAMDRGCEVMWMIEDAAVGSIFNESERTASAVHRWFL